jgi:hypothetical protein
MKANVFYVVCTLKVIDGSIKKVGMRFVLEKIAFDKRNFLKIQCK